MIRAKAAYYADPNIKIKLYDDFIKKKDKSLFKLVAQRRLKELKQDKFLEDD